MQPPENPSPRAFEGFPGPSSFSGKRGTRVLGSKCMVATLVGDVAHRITVQQAETDS
ncbi:hypothetical protein PV703_21995 [Streptomyces sp. ME01-24h]|nr:hypothetical protein [Streptomyces sp. ME01-24h]